MISIVINVGCQTLPAPIDDYVLARAAMEAAKSVQAAKYSPGYWHQAEDSYRKAKVLFNDEDYLEAKKEFVNARKAAEKAENSARLKRQQSGDIL